MAIPLGDLILQEDAKLTASVDAWQKQCGEKPAYDASCMKHYELSGDLGKFVALVNDEVAMLRGSAAPANGADRQSFEVRLREMEYLIDVATNRMRCLGRSPSDATCKAEAAALEKRKSQR